MHTSKGLSLIELLITLLVMSVALLIAVPSFATLIRAQQLDAALTWVQTSLALTRQEAIRSGISASMVKSGAEWEQGWKIFLDANGDGQLSGTETLIKEHDGLSAGLELRGNTPVSSYIRYTPNGRATMVNGAYQMGTLRLCQANNGGAGYQLRLNAGGRFAVSRITDCATTPP